MAPRCAMCVVLLSALGVLASGGLQGRLHTQAATSGCWKPKTCYNSAGGTFPADATNQCQCDAGTAGRQCSQCASDRGCARVNGTCDNSALPHGNGTKQLSCQLQNAELAALLENNGPVLIEIAYHKPTPWNNTDKDGTMEVTLSRYYMGANTSEVQFIDEFFSCQSTKCSVHARSRKNNEGPIYNNACDFDCEGSDSDAPTSNDTSDGVKKEDHDEKQATLSPAGWAILSLLVINAVVLIAAGFMPISLRLKVVKYGGLSLVILLLVYIIVITAGMGQHHKSKPSTHHSDLPKIDQDHFVEVHYVCEQTKCDCLPDAGRGYTPVCEDSPQFLGVLKDIESVEVICDNSTTGPNGAGRCLFTSGTLSIPLGCAMGECIEEKSKASIDVQVVKERSYVLLYVTLASTILVITVVVSHFVYSMMRSRKLGEEWRKEFSGGESRQYQLQDYGENGGAKQGDAAVSTPSLSLAARRLSYRIGSIEERMILDHITFEVPSGKSLAIMGPSGAGKTTLLDLLAAREKCGVTTGSILVNGEPVVASTRTDYRDMIGYVSQEDTLLPSLTVLESVLYSARLRLPSGMPDEVKKARAEEVIESLGLGHCKHTRIGNAQARGISGGEKRRVSIAMELVANPRVLFLDEPTSGLDSYNALVTMETLAKLRTTGCGGEYAAFFDFQPVIIFSIHQPSKEIFSTFDNLLLISKGQVLYCGAANAAMDTFTRYGYKPPEDTTNPADFLLRLANVVSDDERKLIAHAQGRMRCRDGNAGRANGGDEGMAGRVWHDDVTDTSSITSHDVLLVNESLRLPPLRRGNRGEPLMRETPLDAPHDACSGSSVLRLQKERRKYYPNFYEELGVVFKRGFRTLVGSYSLVMCHIAVTLILGIVLSTFYHRQELSIQGTLNRAGSVTYTLLLLAFFSLSALELFMTEREVYVCERNNGYYGSLSYFITKVVFDILLLRVLPPLFLGAMVYEQMGLRTDDSSHFAWFLFVLAAFNVVTAGMAFVSAMIAPTFGSGALVAALGILVVFAFDPLIVQGNLLPSPVQWMKYISPFFLAFESIMVNELQNQQCTFAPSDAAGHVAGAVIPIMCEQYLYNLDLDPQRFGLDITLLVAWAVFYLVLAWVGLWWFVRDTR